jgi:hypothetical protein
MRKVTRRVSRYGACVESRCDAAVFTCSLSLADSFVRVREANNEQDIASRNVGESETSIGIAMQAESYFCPGVFTSR